MSSTKSISSYVHAIITIGLMLFFGMLVEPFGNITPLGMKVLGVFLGMMYGWIFCGLVWPSLFGMVCLTLTGYNSVTNIFCGMFATVTVQVLFCFMIAGLLNSFNVPEYIAGKLMSAKFIIGHPWKLAIMIFLSTAVIAILVDVIPAIFLMWIIFAKAAEEVDCKNTDKFYGFVVAGTVMASALAGMILPFKVTAVSYLGFINKVFPIELPPVQFILFTTIFVTVLMAIYLAFGKYVFKIDVTKFETNVDTFSALRGTKASRQQKIGLAFIAAFIGILMWPSIFPKEWMITQVFSNMGLIGVIVTLITIGFFIKDDEGKQIVTVPSLTKGIGWDMIFLIGSTFPIAEAIRSADCGVMTTINAIIRPMAMDLGPTMLLVISVFVLGALTQITHNAVLGAMFMPFLIPLYAELGGNPIVYWIMIYFALNLAFSTPAASAYSGFIFGHECFREKATWAYIYGLLVFIVAAIMLIASMPILNMIM